MRIWEKSAVLFGTYDRPILPEQIVEPRLILDAMVRHHLEYDQKFLFSAFGSVKWKDFVWGWGPAVGGTRRHDWVIIDVVYERDFFNKVFKVLFIDNVWICRHCNLVAGDRGASAGPDPRWDRFEEVSCDYLVVQKVLKE